MCLKLKLKRKVYLILIFPVFLLLFFYFLFFSPKARIVGTWTTDSVTVYEFYKNNTGKLIVSLTEYDFRYSLKNHTLSIVFDSEKSKDTNYQMEFL